MILDAGNLQQWKEELDLKIKTRYSISDKLSETMDDDYWLEEYTGLDTEEAISDEVQYWDD